MSKVIAKFIFWAVVVITGGYLVHDLLTPATNVYAPITVALGNATA